MNDPTFASQSDMFLIFLFSAFSPVVCMFELLFLLLPVAAAYGYYMGRSSMKNSDAAGKTQSARTYLKGVDYLLDNNKEQAVEKFIAYLNSAAPSAENSIALGRLFRKRGEVDRAISLHSSIAADPDIEPHEGEMASLELAADFISAGLLDRAESILLDLVEIPRQRREAAGMLIRVYEQEREFAKAIDTGNSLRDALSSSSLNRLANHHCELAQQCFVSERNKEALLHLKSALELNPDSVRARYMQCEELIRQDQSEAGKAKVTLIVSDILSRDPSCGLICLELLQKCFQCKTDPLYVKALEDLLSKSNSAAAAVELSSLMMMQGRQDEAEELLMRYIKIRPNLKLFSALMGVRASDGKDAAEMIMNLKALLDAGIAANPKYSCAKCGFESGIMFWQCPSCRSWDTLRPKSSLAGD